ARRRIRRRGRGLGPTRDRDGQNAEAQNCRGQKGLHEASPEMSLNVLKCQSPALPGELDASTGSYPLVHYPPAEPGADGCTCDRVLLYVAAQVKVTASLFFAKSAEAPSVALRRPTRRVPLSVGRSMPPPCELHRQASALERTVSVACPTGRRPA